MLSAKNKAQRDIEDILIKLEHELDTPIKSVRTYDESCHKPRGEIIVSRRVEIMMVLE